MSVGLPDPAHVEGGGGGSGGSGAPQVEADGRAGAESGSSRATPLSDREGGGGGGRDDSASLGAKVDAIGERVREAISASTTPLGD